MARRLSSPVFVGRQSELTRLQSAADAGRSGHPGLVLVGGEAGVGKTRLLAELVTRQRDTGWLVLEGAAIAVGAEGLPFEPFIAAFRSAVRALGVERVAALAGPNLPDLARLVPELASATNQVVLGLSQTEWLQVRTYEGVLGLLERLGEEAPVLLLIEDVHWADRSTRDLLTFLARNVRAERLLLVATFRADELHRRHPLVAWLAEVERLPAVERIDLPRFDRPELAELLGGILGTPAPAALVESIAGRSDGNAFFAEELVSAVDDDGSGHLPATLREIVLARLSSLSEPAGRLVEVAAVAGREVDHDLLANVVALPEPEVLAALRETVASHLLVAVTDGAVERYRFRHALVQEAVYDDMLPSDRRQLHGGYARAIAEGGGAADGSRASRLVELAHHWRAAHESALALRAAIEAGDATRSGFAFAEAATMYERAIELWDLVQPAERPADRDLGDLYVAASAMVALVGDPSRAVTLAERAIDELDQSTDSASLARRATARERLGRAAWLAGDGARSIAALEEAAAMLRDAPPSIEQARVQAGLAANLMLAGRLAESQPVAERAIEIARAVGSQEIEAHALSTLGVDRASLGAIREGIALLERSLEMASAIGDATTIGRAFANLGTVRQMGGDLEGALATYRLGIEACRRYGNERTYGTYLAINSAGELILLGRTDEAATLLAETLAGGILPGIATVHFYTTSASLRVRIGDLAAARADLEVSRREAARIEDVQFVGDLEGITAELALEEDDPATALVAVHRGFERIGAGIDPRVIGPLAQFGVRAAADMAVAARARRDEPAVAAAVTEARRLAERFVASIALLPDSDDLARAEIDWVDRLLRAEIGRATGDEDPAAWAELRATLAAHQMPFLEAYVLWRAADAAPGGAAVDVGDALREAHQIVLEIGASRLAARIASLARRRRVDLVAPAAASASEVAAAGEGAAAGRPTEAPADPFGLTTREREILRLLADGFSNRRIAETLFISESTAGVHVSNILGKLGVASRTEAATTAVRLGLDREG
jgi:ATP/maltotriose-dependent transcriptional regulator MalT